MSDIKCVKYNCPYYRIEVDGAGGSLETCKGIVMRETGHWTDKKDREYNFCNKSPEEIKQLSK